MWKKLRHRLIDELVHPAPLVAFRILFGLAMFLSTARFLLLGWVKEQYILPTYHFSYYAFGWVQVLPPWGMYGLYMAMLFSSLGIAFGLFYRVSSIVYFLAFTYTELIDKTYYLNHYYFVSLVAFWMCLVPAHRYFSMDVWRRPSLLISKVPAWTINIFKFQLGCVYFFAGVAKINGDWLLKAMPLKLWLPAQDTLWVIGPLLREKWVAYAFSWLGMLFDVSVPFLLLWKRSRIFAYCTLLFFHSITGYFFQIGVFPLVMSTCTLIFFSESFHQRWLSRFDKEPYVSDSVYRFPLPICSILVPYLLLQLALPWRYLLYPGHLFWTEEGYRFSWRVMLMEKAGSATFRIRDNNTGNEFEVINSQFLNTHQEKQMAFQPDMILSFAHHLGNHYKRIGIERPSVYCDCHVTMNGRASRLIVDPQVDLFQQEEGFSPKRWILPYSE